MLFVLETDVTDVGLPARRNVARHLECHRRLAGPLGTTDEQELTGPQAAADRLVERREAQRTAWYRRGSRWRSVVEVNHHVERRARDQAPGRRIETPLALAHGWQGSISVLTGLSLPRMRRQRDRPRPAS